MLKTPPKIAAIGLTLSALALLGGSTWGETTAAAEPPEPLDAYELLVEDLAPPTLPALPVVEERMPAPRPDGAC